MNVLSTEPSRHVHTRLVQLSSRPPWRETAVEVRHWTCVPRAYPSRDSQMQPCVSHVTRNTPVDDTGGVPRSKHCICIATYVTPLLLLASLSMHSPMHLVYGI